MVADLPVAAAAQYSDSTQDLPDRKRQGVRITSGTDADHVDEVWVSVVVGQRIYPRIRDRDVHAAGRQ